MLFPSGIACRKQRRLQLRYSAHTTMPKEPHLSLLHGMPTCGCFYVELRQQCKSTNSILSSVLCDWTSLKAHPICLTAIDRATSSQSRASPVQLALVTVATARLSLQPFNSTSWTNNPCMQSVLIGRTNLLTRCNFLTLTTSITMVRIGNLSNANPNL
jgi:hypothetical protein